MPPVTLETPAWMTYRSAWKSARGIDTPHIAEIAPAQYARLSKRAKREYDAKRDRDWSASADGSRAYAEAVLVAWKAGEFTLDHPDLNPDAREVVRSWRVEQLKEREREQQHLREQENAIAGMDDLEVGMAVFSPIYREGVVIKKNRTSAKVRFGTWETNVQPHLLQRQNLHAKA